MPQKQLSREDLANIAGLLMTVKNDLPINQAMRDVAAKYTEELYGMAAYLAYIDEKRIAISEYFHHSNLHPAIRQMSPDRVEQTYDRLVEQGKIKEGEN
ncbi:hypothetical protein SEA_TRIBBY_58 [Arthrobacter phage Tribby]|uniref:Uncharacterized protein n=1 Tax=Arthrobacter phage Tribby TaxID=2024279 RepID=A0A222Z7M1_9CAUD|nr:hypothetical protein PQB75_gp058 [Arthrobacter phage Tribby]ASR80509.1 hypothetical protein SEA_TRIBBY_58 [Arthrobacter phage Tribby]